MCQLSLIITLKAGIFAVDHGRLLLITDGPCDRAIDNLLDFFAAMLCLRKQSIKEVQYNNYRLEMFS